MRAGQDGSVMVATIQDGDPGLSASSFVVQIDPGDGPTQSMGGMAVTPVSEAGVVTALGGGLYQVSLPYGHGQVVAGDL